MALVGVDRRLLLGDEEGAARLLDLVGLSFSDCAFGTLVGLVLMMGEVEGLGFEILTGIEILTSGHFFWGFGFFEFDEKSSEIKREKSGKSRT